MTKRRIRVTLAWLLVTAIVAGLATAVVLYVDSCRRTIRYDMDERPVHIAVDGRLFFESQPINESELVALVHERRQRKAPRGRRAMYGVVLLVPDDDTPYGTVRAVGDLIREAGGAAGFPLSPKRRTCDTVTHTDIWNEQIQRPDRPVPSDELFEQLGRHRLRLKSSGTLLLNGQVVTEQELIALAHERVYLSLTTDADDVQRMQSVTCFHMVVETNTPYCYVQNVEDVLALNQCRVGISLARDNDALTTGTPIRETRP
jgi:biopolymer transport protein ExbD